MALARNACNSANVAVGVSRSMISSPSCERVDRRHLAGIAPARDVPGAAARLHGVVDGGAALASMVLPSSSQATRVSHGARRSPPW